MKVRVALCGAVAIGSLVMGLAVDPAWAQVGPGDFITPENAAKVKALVSPGVYYKVAHGMTMKIVPTEQVDWPPPYKEATEKYSPQVRLSADHRSLVGYAAGQPFPFVDVNDPYVAEKIIWNNAFRPISTDDYDLRFYDCDSEYGGYHQSYKPIFSMQVGHYAGYGLVGRTEVEPLPIDPDFLKSGRYWLSGLYPVLAPQQARGEGFIRYRYAAPNRPDDEWTWVPGQRRVRRLSEEFLSISPGALVGDPDHFLGFVAKTEEYNYKLLAAKPMLASVHAEHSPEIRCGTDGGASACPEAWELRNLYVVEATPRPDRIHPLQSKTVLYIDSEMWFEPYVDTYDRRGELFQNQIHWLAYRDRPVPDARVAIYPFKREFVVATAQTDVQGGLSTMCYLPSAETNERECWYINMASVDRNFFTVPAMVRSAP
jgi:uncharacterized protein DUF1329